MLLTKNSKNKAKQRTAKPTQIQIHIVIPINTPPFQIDFIYRNGNLFFLFPFFIQIIQSYYYYEQTDNTKTVKPPAISFTCPW